MPTVHVALGSNGYSIYIGTPLLARGELLAQHLPQKRVVVITDTVVAPLYLKVVTDALVSAGVRVTRVIIPAGEQHKDWHTLNAVFDALLAARCERKTTLLALGGGVVGDLAGFAAATFLRGVPLIQLPTTLLAQVDSAVGGKTAINHPRGKNMIGAFYQPLAVIADTAILNTLPDRELSGGIAEVIKYGLIRDGAFFEWLERNIDALVSRDAEALTYAIQRSCEHKAAVVSVDVREEGAERALLNLGHTFGHAIEAGLGYGTWMHGEAVAAGTVIAARISQRMGLIGDGDVARIVTLFERARLPIVAPDLGLEQYMNLMELDKKVAGGKLRFILLHTIGSAFIASDVPRRALKAALADSVKHA